MLATRPRAEGEAEERLRGEGVEVEGGGPGYPKGRNTS